MALACRRPSILPGAGRAVPAASEAKQCMRLPAVWHAPPSCLGLRKVLSLASVLSGTHFPPHSPPFLLLCLSPCLSVQLLSGQTPHSLLHVDQCLCHHLPHGLHLLSEVNTFHNSANVGQCAQWAVYCAHSDLPAMLGAMHRTVTMFCKQLTEVEAPMIKVLLCITACWHVFGRM